MHLGILRIAKPLAERHGNELVAKPNNCIPMNVLITLTSVLYMLLYPLTSRNTLDFEDPSTHRVGASTQLDIKYWANPRICYDTTFYKCNSAEELAKLAKFHFDHPNYIIQIGVHSDSRGPDHFNLRLTEMRASNVKFALYQRHQCDTTKFKIKGFGEGAPIVPESVIMQTTSKQEQQCYYSINARTVITLLDTTSRK